MLDSGIRGAMYRAICSLYSACESCVKLGGEAGYTDFFPVEAGVRQGCILSPLLYSLFINGLAMALKASGLGATIDGRDGGRMLTVLLYADDIVLLAESPAQLQWLMGIVHSYCVRWRMQVNHAKCGLIRFNVTGAVLPTHALTIGATPIAWLDSYKYLGVELRAAPGRPFHLFRRRMLSAAKRAAGHIAGMGMFSGKLPVPLGIRVYKALVRPLLEFCAEVTSLQPWSDAEQLQTAVGKRILQCPRYASATAAQGDLGWTTLEG